MPAGSLAVIGAGFHSATNILPACVLGDIRIEAIATRDLARSSAALLRFGSTGAPYDDAGALLADPEIANVAIIAQPVDQARLSREAIRAGKNVFADKPLGWDAAEARVLAEEAAAHDVVLMVGFMKRHAPVYRRLGELIEAGELGTIRSFHLAFGCDSSRFCANEDQFVKRASIHVIDLVRFLFGEVATVHVVSNTEGNRVSLALALRFESGVVGTMELSGLPGYSSETELLRVSGDNGYAVAEDLTRLSTHRGAPGEEATWKSLSERTVVFTPAESTMSGTARELYLRGFVGEMVAFVESVAAGTEPSSSGRDNVLTMELCERILTGSAASAPI